MDFEFQASITQGFMFLSMAFVLPWVIEPNRRAVSRFTRYSAVIWFAYTLVAMGVDNVLGEGVPGIGYVMMGFLAWLIGSSILRSRVSSRYARRAGPAAIPSGRHTPPPQPKQR